MGTVATLLAENVSFRCTSVDRIGIRRRAAHRPPRPAGPGLRFGEPQAMALLASVASFAHVVGGLTNPGLCRHMVELFDPAYTSRQASYDLRRLRLKGLVERVPHTRTCRVTEHGRRIAGFFTRLAARVVVPALTELAAIDRPPPSAPSPVVSAWRAYDAELAKMARALAKAA